MAVQQTQTTYFIKKDFSSLKIETPQSMKIYQQVVFFEETTCGIPTTIKSSSGTYTIKVYSDGHCIFSILNQQRKVLTTRYYKLASQIIK